MTMAIGIALVVALVATLLALAAFVSLRGSDGAPEAKTEPEKPSSKSTVAPADTPVATPDWANAPPPPAAPDEVLAVDPILSPMADSDLGDRFSDDAEDEDMVTVQASPEELAKMLAEIRGRND